MVSYIKVVLHIRAKREKMSSPKLGPKNTYKRIDNKNGDFIHKCYSNFGHFCIEKYDTINGFIFIKKSLNSCTAYNVCAVKNALDECREETKMSIPIRRFLNFGHSWTKITQHFIRSSFSSFFLFFCFDTINALLFCWLL